jgi:hypothetical protein
MSRYILPAGLRFNDCLFTEPVPIAIWHPPGCAGIVTVLLCNPQWGPKPFQPVYVAAFGNDATRGNILPAPVGRDDLLISVLPMPYSTEAQRRSLCRELIAAYNPVCQANTTFVSASELARKVDELEVRQQEQNDRILSLLAHIGKMFELAPVAGPRRPIGFLPQLLPIGDPAPTGDRVSQSGS